MTSSHVSASRAKSALASCPHSCQHQSSEHERAAAGEQPPAVLLWLQQQQQWQQLEASVVTATAAQDVRPGLLQTACSPEPLAGNQLSGTLGCVWEAKQAFPSSVLCWPPTPACLITKQISAAAVWIIRGIAAWPGGTPALCRCVSVLAGVPWLRQAAGPSRVRLDCGRGGPPLNDRGTGGASCMTHCAHALCLVVLTHECIHHCA